jgi:hypothetical protein
MFNKKSIVFVIIVISVLNYCVEAAGAEAGITGSCSCVCCNSGQTCNPTFRGNILISCSGSPIDTCISSCADTYDCPKSNGCLSGAWDYTETCDGGEQKGFGTFSCPRLSPGAIAGIVIGVVIAVALVSFWVYRRRRRGLQNSLAYQARVTNPDYQAAA